MSDLRVYCEEQQGLRPVPIGSDGWWSVREGQTLRLEVWAEAPAAFSLPGAELSLLPFIKDGNHWVTQARLQLWTWAGFATVAVEAGRWRGSFQLDVQPHPGKLGREAFWEMVTRVQRRLRDGAMGFSPGEVRVALAQGSVMCVHPAAIEAELPRFLKALRLLEQDPLRWFVRRRQAVPWRVSQRVDSATLTWLSRHPKAFERVTAGLSQTSVEQSVSQHTLNHPANRYLKWLLTRLRISFHKTQSALKAFSRRDPLEAARRQWLADQLNGAMKALSESLKSPVMQSIKAARPSASATQAIFDHPLYSRTIRSAQRLLHPGVQLDPEGPLSSGLKATWDLFELDVLFRLLDSLRALLPEWKWSFPSPCSSNVLTAFSYNATWRATSGRFRIELRFQQIFNARDKTPTSGCHSITGERRPDFILGFFEGDALQRWMLFDAKYRASRQAIHDSFSSLHIYRDALRWHGKQATRGLLLVPNLADNAQHFRSDTYQQETGLGAVTEATPTLVEFLGDLPNSALLTSS